MLEGNNDDAKPGLEERYIGATNSSNLTLNPDGPCDATQLIAAGLLGNRMGEALSHLRAEWDGADKPRKATEAEIMARAAEIPIVKGKKAKPDVKRARAEALMAYQAALRHRAHSLAGWLPALSIMAEWARVREVDADLLSPALYHWLAPTCPVCGGLGHLRMEDAPVLGRQCYFCSGAGTWPQPLGAQRIKNWLKGCAGKAKRDRGGLLRGEIEAPTMKERLHSEIGPDDSPEEAARVAEVFRASMARTR